MSAVVRKLFLLRQGIIFQHIFSVVTAVWNLEEDDKILGSTFLYTRHR